jgi:hypothetical protein
MQKLSNPKCHIHHQNPLELTRSTFQMGNILCISRICGDEGCTLEYNLYVIQKYKYSQTMKYMFVFTKFLFS